MTVRAARAALALVAAVLSPPQPVVTAGRDTAAAVQRAGAPVPWTVGEKLTYDVRFGPLKVGTGSMEVGAVENVRGHEAYHTIFRVRGGTFVYRVDDVFESWLDVRTLSSLRFYKEQDEGHKERHVRIEIFPERQTFSENGGAEEPSVANPLDDGSFLFYVRTLPLHTGDNYDLPRYFRPDRNPVRIRVLRRESVTVPAGKFDAVVVQPVIKTKGIFSEGGRAEVWLSDDDRRIVLKMTSSLSFGTLSLYLRSRS